MARVTYVKSAKGRKDGTNRRCTRCGKDIEPGQPYKWFANRIGRSSQRKDFCDTCRIRQSDMTTSPHLQALYGAQEGAEDELAKGGDLTLSDLAEIVRAYGESVREVGEGYAESADNIEEGFGHETSQSEEIREKSEECESAADTIDSAADDIENMDDPDAEQDEFLDEFEGTIDAITGKPTDEADYNDYVEEKRADRREAAFDAANEAISEGPGL